MGGDGFIIDGLVGGGVSVQLSPCVLNDAQELFLVQICRALEHHVFKQVRKATAPVGVVCPAHTIPHIDRHHRRGAVLYNRDF